MFSSSLFLSVSATILSLSPCVSAQTYSYTLQDTYAGSSFYDYFNFYTGADPTNGFVQYVDRSTANASGLIGFGQGTAKWGVDNTTTLSSTSAGRNSVRLEGNTNYNHGLFIADIKHMPGSICGVWPAFWTLGGGTWPADGEMDIIEGVNLNSGNQITAHTAPNCTMAFTGQTGPVVGSDYDCAVASGGSSGCSVGSSQANDYGSNFNANGGGVYVMQWTSAFIKVWFFPRTAIPASITAGAPDYTTFGTPQANFDGGSCNIDQHFIDHRIIFDTTFCGDWAGAVYSSSSCPNAASGSNGCVNYVAATPGAFSEAYWEVNSIKVYSESVLSSSAASSSSSATSSSSSLSSSTSSSSSVPSSTLASTTSSSLASSTALSVSSKTSSSLITSTTSQSSAASTVKVSSTSSSVRSSSTVSSSSASSSSVASRSSTPSTSPSSSISSSSLISSAKTSQSTTSSTLATSTKSSSLATSSSAKTSSTSTKTSSSSSINTSKTSSTSATPTTTSASCPASNGDIFVSNNKRFIIECSTDHNGGNLKSVTVSSSGGLAACISACATTTGCVDVTLSGTTCYMKSKLTTSSTSPYNGARLLA